MPKRKAPPAEEEEEEQPTDDLTVGDAPTSIDPYEVLSLPHDATADAVRSAYRKAALKHHPDKVAPEAKEAAHTKFQEIALAYAVLSDSHRRARYDATGRTEESLDLDDDDFDWTTYFREQYSEAVTGNFINRFAQSYKGSDEEREHVLRAYQKHKGSMGKLYQDVMLSDMLEDEKRYRGWIDKAIKDGEVEEHKKYVEESEVSRRRRMARERKKRQEEAEEVEEAEAEMEEKRTKAKAKAKATGKGKGKKNGGGVDELAALIQQRQKARGVDYLANSRGPPNGEPPEEAFAKNRKLNRWATEAESNKRTKR